MQKILQSLTADERLGEGAQRLQFALSAGRLGDWSWDAASDLVTLGAEAAAAFGLPPATQITWAELRKSIHAEDRERNLEAVQQAVESGSDYDIEYRIVQPDGTYKWLAIKGRPLYGSDGTVTAMVGVVQNVTAQKGAEEVRSRLAAVVESSADAIISMTLDTTITTWNKSAERIFGYSAAEAIGKSINIIIPPGSEEEETLIIQRLLAGERLDHYETIRRCKDGRLLNVSLAISPILDSSGKIIGVSKISRDITEQKRAERALQEETRLLELLNNSGRAIASQLDLEAVVQTVTDSATQLSGARFGAFFYNVIGERGASLALFALSGASREAFEKLGHPGATPLFSPAFKGEGPVRSDDITQDARYGQIAPHYGMPQGHPAVRSFLSVPVISRTGEVIGGLFFGHPDRGVFTERSERLVVGMAAQAATAIDNARLYDAAQKEITQRKRAEEALQNAQGELREYAGKLEEQVAERTARLRETIQELEAFSYSVSHDMRSPLRAMQGYADALLEDYGRELDPTAADYLNRIRRAAVRMDSLIQDVLAYSRVSKGDIELREIDIENVIRDVIQNYPALQKENADINVESPIPPVRGHEAYLTQIVSNLLGNAIKFVRPGVRPAIQITARPEGGMVRVSFKDNGIGIAPEYQEQIFEMFERVHSEREFEGTGVGLAIVKKAVERMGGTLGVHSEPGQGSDFFFLLPKA